MRSLETIKADNAAAARGEYKPAQLPKLKPWDREAAAQRLQERKKLNGGYTKGAH